MDYHDDNEATLRRCFEILWPPGADPDDQWTSDELEALGRELIRWRRRSREAREEAEAQAAEFEEALMALSAAWPDESAWLDEAVLGAKEAEASCVTGEGTTEQLRWLLRQGHYTIDELWARATGPSSIHRRGGDDYANR